MRRDLVELVMETLAGYQPKVSDEELKQIRSVLQGERIREFVAAGYAVGVSHGAEDVRTGRDRALTAERLLKRGEEIAWAIVTGHTMKDAQAIATHVAGTVPALTALHEPTGSGEAPSEG